MVYTLYYDSHGLAGYDMFLEHPVCCLKVCSVEFNFST